MPELDQDCIPSHDTPTVPSAAPATIDPTIWEDFPVFRETFLMYISEPQFNMSLRMVAEYFFSMLLEVYQGWPQWQDTSTRVARLLKQVADTMETKLAKGAA